jgi:hypothetical protein
MATPITNTDEMIAELIAEVKGLRADLQQQSAERTVQLQSNDGNTYTVQLQEPQQPKRSKR